MNSELKNKMMDSKDYEDWFGIPLEKKEEEEELEEGEIKDNSIKDIKENNFNNKNIHKSFLSKKRKNVNPFEENDKNNNDNLKNIKELRWLILQNTAYRIKPWNSTSGIVKIGTCFRKFFCPLHIISIKLFCF